jgi:hypothetical protein
MKEKRMETDLLRREFLKSCSQAGLCCGFLLCSLNSRAEEEDTEIPKEKKEPPDPEKLTYCGHQCNMKCDLYKATVENDLELKKKVHKEWQFKEQHGVDFDADIVFCHGCKVEDKPKNLILNKCTVRKCVIEKKLASCIQCKALKKCDQELWTRFPKFKEHIEKIQVDYVELSGKELI